MPGSRLGVLKYERTALYFSSRRVPDWLSIRISFILPRVPRSASVVNLRESEGARVYDVVEESRRETGQLIVDS